jgi:hypothetical protein
MKRLIVTFACAALLLSGCSLVVQRTQYKDDGKTTRVALLGLVPLYAHYEEYTDPEIGMMGIEERVAVEEPAAPRSRCAIAQPEKPEK